MINTFPAEQPSLIASVTLAADAATVTFSNIPQSYRHLRLMAAIRSSLAAGTDDVALRINGDAVSGNYFWKRLIGGTGTAVSADTGTGVASMVVGKCAADSNTAAEFSGLVVDLPGYSTAKFQNVTAQSSETNDYVVLGSGAHYVAGPTTSVTLFVANGNVRAGSLLSLYGFA